MRYDELIKQLEGKTNVEPVPRAWIPADMLEDFDRHYGRVDFFSVIVLGPNWISVSPEGTDAYREAIGKPMTEATAKYRAAIPALSEDKSAPAIGDAGR